jgi:hypothetical protein
LKEPSNAKADPITPYLTAISIVAIAGLLLMLGGAIALRNGAQFHEELIGVFMLMTFVIVGMVEVFLCRQLSRLTKTAEKRTSLAPPEQATGPGGLRAAQLRALAEPVPGVTENTTRTLEYSRNEPSS